jgi:hypothetical protein
LPATARDHDDKWQVATLLRLAVEVKFEIMAIWTAEDHGFGGLLSPPNREYARQSRDLQRLGTTQSIVPRSSESLGEPFRQASQQ